MEEKIATLKRIANHLIINSSFIEDLGLYNGKMGIVLFFAHYARFVNNSVLEDFMGELLDEIYEEIDEQQSIDLKNGLCGIGWGILYLLKHKFVEGVPSIILKNIDYQIINSRITYKDINELGLDFYIKERIMADDYNEYYHKYIRFLKKSKSEDINMFISSDFNINTNIRNWKLGLFDGCAGFGLKLILE